MSDLLTQEELNALLSGIDEFDGGDELELDNVDDAETSDRKIRNYDFSRREKIIRGHMPFLDRIAENFAGLFRSSLSVFLGQSLEIERSGIQVQHFFEYTQGWPQHTLFSLARFAPLRGRVVVAIEPNLSFAVIDHYFGGQSSRRQPAKNGVLSPVMMRVMELMLALVFSDLSKAWRPVVEIDVDYCSPTLNPDFANIAGPDEVLVMSIVRIQLKGGEGNLHVAMPYAMVEPVKDMLSSSGTCSPENDQLWKEAFRRQLLDTEVTVTSQLLEKQMALREVMRLKKGDVISLGRLEDATLKVQGISLYTGKSGVSEGRKALSITGRTDRNVGRKFNKIC